MLSANYLNDFTPYPLEDGRIIYSRWEYVDKHFSSAYGLWTVNPDGTGVMVYFGNQCRGYAMLDAKPIPGTRSAVASCSLASR